MGVLTFKVKQHEIQERVVQRVKSFLVKLSSRKLLMYQYTRLSQT